MRPSLVLCAAVSLLASPGHAADRTASSEARQEIRIVPSVGTNAPTRVVIAGVNTPQMRASRDTRTSDLLTEILSSTGERLAIVTDHRSRTVPDAARRIEGTDGQVLPMVDVATEAAASERATGVLPTSTVTWKAADGSVMTIAAYGDAPIELVAGPVPEALPKGPADAPTSVAPRRFEFALLPIAPNPVRGALTVRFRLPEPGNVTLDLFDPSGRRVSHLLDEARAAGEHTAPFTSASLPPGHYYFRLTYAGSSGTARQIATQALVLLK
jgi:hypothetical protein